ncbi:MAG: pantetheine-phosphate adenylyltransferase [Gammaproteobacteria bacterium]|nr:pantetheine-phosphate adenylyltransferase [Gammaproteobacteria bacterium]MDE0454415.1 pantetheine-phosphate adenylyltransferase [Gammaproteobacteria bacterium]
MNARRRSAGTRRGIMYPGTFDPITNGHSDLVTRAATLFDEVVVAVAASPSKSPMFDLETRIRLAAEVLADVPEARVEGYEGLTVEYARVNGLHAILRGLRAVSDFEHEFQLASMNRRLDSSIETVYLTPSESYAHVSSSLVREIAGMGGDVSNFVHPAVVTALKEHL